MYLLDTNVISELRKLPERRNPGLQRWFDLADSDALYLSVLAIGEIRKGIESKMRRWVPMSGFSS